MNKEEYILCAAIKRLTTKDCTKHYNNNDIYNIEIGYRHCDIFGRFKFYINDAVHLLGSNGDCIFVIPVKCRLCCRRNGRFCGNNGSGGSRCLRRRSIAAKQ